jgi:hypothetical protein
MHKIIQTGSPWSHIRVWDTTRPADLHDSLAALDEARALDFPVLADLSAVTACAVDTFELSRSLSGRLRMPPHVAFIVGHPANAGRLRQMLHGAGLSGAAEVFMSEDDAVRWLIAAPALSG